MAKDKKLLNCVRNIIIMGMAAASVIMIIFPVPAQLLDVLIVLNLLFAFAFFLAALCTYSAASSTKKTEHFHTFPVLILLSTIFCLAINISATRLILTKGTAFDGRLIRSISLIATGSGEIVHLVAGSVIFIVIIAVQMGVISKGANRISEVTARFVLEEMVKKQMINESELSLGVINQEEADLRKETLKKDCDFLCSMDGVCKFISGIEKIRLFIIAVNVIGGLIIGYMFHGEQINDTIKTYVPLAIGNGLLSMFPAIFLSLTAKHTTKRLLDMVFAVMTNNVKNTHEERLTQLDTLLLELGYGLIPLVEKENGAELMIQIQGMRRVFALELGITVPRIRIIDNAILEPSEYCFWIEGVKTGTFTIRMGCCLCINTGTVTKELEGEKIKDPAFGLPALWISEDRRDEAEKAGYTVVDPPALIAKHLGEIIKSHAAEIFKTHDVQFIIDGIKNENSALVEEVLKQFTIEQIHIILQNLLKEQVSIRNMVKILELLVEHGSDITDIKAITDKVKEALCTAR